MASTLLLDLAPFRNRDRLGEFLNRRGLTGQGVEVGTHRGDFAAALLSRWTGFLHLVDPWSDVTGYEEQARDLKHLWNTSGDRSRDLDFCRERLRQHAKRTKFHQATSQQAASTFADNGLDLVYLDGDHRDFMVALDLELWWPKVKPGGVLAGHDVLCIGELGGGWGRNVQSALFPFATLRGLTVNLIMEEDNSPWSFYLFKPEGEK